MLTVTVKEATVARPLSTSGARSLPMQSGHTGDGGCTILRQSLQRSIRSSPSAPLVQKKLFSWSRRGVNLKGGPFAVTGEDASHSGAKYASATVGISPAHGLPGSSRAPGALGVLGAKRILVVGASAGIGKAIAIQAVRSGARVALAARRTHLLELPSRSRPNSRPRGQPPERVGQGSAEQSAEGSAEQSARGCHRGVRRRVGRGVSRLRAPRTKRQVACLFVRRHRRANHPQDGRRRVQPGWEAWMSWFTPRLRRL